MKQKDERDQKCNVKDRGDKYIQNLNGKTWSENTNCKM